MVVSLIGSWIKQSEYSRPEICERFGISQNTLSNWCTCKTYPSIPQAFALAALLGVKVDDLYAVKEDVK
ncbi:helix-turn-helix transcriptional regulator [Bacillus sp. EB106-08-02-XG196]|uniref:helix-turn-helix transcriptional regulator n=1 Tax=Bacillus sp. EB106-08-02-XG196 TaxID=2737049 RepID=UPI0015C46929|nr:helix-turn-helix transcriptional regulator [Bacillus sp. EB106-08-02-XG196]NWQ40372.1 helix-turn-helix transcriptional regulator [Bacillus sp. EB106-08-02-XG196]